MRRRGSVPAAARKRESKRNTDALPLAGLDTNKLQFSMRAARLSENCAQVFPLGMQKVSDIGHPFFEKAYANPQSETNGQNKRYAHSFRANGDPHSTHTSTRSPSALSISTSLPITPCLTSATICFKSILFSA